MVVLGKGLTGGYFPLAITLISEKLFLAFDGSVSEGRALAYGLSYTGNALGCAAAKASLQVFEKEDALEALQPKIRHLKATFVRIANLPGVKEVRQCGFIVGIEMEQSHASDGIESGGCGLYRGAASWPSNQADLECDRPDAAIMHHHQSIR